MKPILMIFLCAFGITVSTLTYAAKLGRLFFTPEQRTQLEYAHASGNPAEQKSPSALIINGIVQKQGGARTVWINGVPRSAGGSDERAPESQTIAVPGKSQPVKAKVGQRILLDQSAPADENKRDP